MDEYEIERLLAATGRGEQKALSRLYRRAGPRLFALALRILQERREAEEALAQSFATIVRHATRQPATGVRPLTFMLAITRDVCVARLRARRDPNEALATAMTVAAGAERADQPPAGEDGRRLATALALLPAEDARLVRAAYFGAVTPAALAAMPNALPAPADLIAPLAEALFR